MRTPNFWRMASAQMVAGALAFGLVGCSDEPADGSSEEPGEKPADDSDQTGPVDLDPYGDPSAGPCLPSEIEVTRETDAICATPCSTNDDCPAPSTSAQVACARFIDSESACHLLCSDDAECPDGASCATGHCFYPLPDSGGGDTSSGGTTSTGGSSGGDWCSECLSECQGLPNCCTGSGCECEFECLPTEDDCGPDQFFCCSAFSCYCQDCWCSMAVCP